MTSTHPEDYDRDDVDQPVLPTQQPEAEPVSDSSDDADEQPATDNPDAKS